MVGEKADRTRENDYAAWVHFRLLLIGGELMGMKTTALRCSDCSGFLC